MAGRLITSGSRVTPKEGGGDVTGLARDEALRPTAAMIAVEIWDGRMIPDPTPTARDTAAAWLLCLIIAALALALSELS
jgi:hypothetical protein